MSQDDCRIEALRAAGHGEAADMLAALPSPGAAQEKAPAREEGPQGHLVTPVTPTEGQAFLDQVRKAVDGSGWVTIPLEKGR